MKRILPAIFALWPGVILADTHTVLSDHILPGYAAFADSTATLATVAENCDIVTSQAAYQDAFDAWMGVSHITFGPLEDNALALAIAFWPDTRNLTEKTISQFIANEDPIAMSPDDFADVSVAAQGFFALERVLYDQPAFSDYTCALTHSIATVLARNAATLRNDWDKHAVLMTSAGDTGNDRYQSDEDVTRATYTALFTGLSFLHEQRLGRPLGTFDQPRPTRAEARRSGRSMRNITLHLTALRDLARAMADNPTPKSDAAFEAALAQAALIDDPSLEGVTDPLRRIRVEALQSRVYEIEQAVTTEIGDPLGISAGFNSMDGD